MAINSDRPVYKDNDEFNRYSFAERIGRAIVNRSESDGFVVGIYGRWGEGKSSILNFIQEFLEEQGTKIITFNPWRYTGEEQVLLGFFAELATGLDISLDGSVTTVVESFRKYMNTIKYVSSFVATAFPNNSLEQGKAINDFTNYAAIEGLKQQIKDKLNADRRRIVVFIDDIDRLNEQEIRALFQLVKLNADFDYVTYVLSFDDKIVARAISNAYDGANESVGYDYLEKIVQVSLRVPIIHANRLQQFVAHNIESAISSTGIRLSDDDLNRFLSLLPQNILLKINTPRLIKRYCNTIAMIIPLLLDEVNYGDLLILEALRIINPNIYYFIAANPTYFVGSNIDVEQQTYDDVKLAIRSFLELHSSNDDQAIILIGELFPKVKATFQKKAGNPNPFRLYSNEELYVKKSIASEYHFKRYFSYNIEQGEIPEVEFQELLHLLENEGNNLILEKAEKLTTRVNISGLIDKINIHVDNLTSKQKLQTIQLIKSYVPTLKNEDGILTRTLSEAGSAVSLIGRILGVLPATERYTAAIDILTTSPSFRFGYDVAEAIVTKRYETTYNNNLDTYFDLDAPRMGDLFTNEEYSIICQQLVNRALREAEDRPIFEAFPFESGKLMTYFWPIANGPEARVYLTNRLEKNPIEVMGFLKVLSSPIPVGLQQGYGGISFNQYKLIRATYDVASLASIVSTFAELPEAYQHTPEHFERPVELTDVERCHQFLHQHESFEKILRLEDSIQQNEAQLPNDL